MSINRPHVDLSLGLDVCHAGVRQVRLPEHPDTLNQVEVVTSARTVVHDLLVTLCRARIDDPDTTRQLLDALMMTDAHLSHIKAQENGEFPGGGDEWATAYDRAAHDRDVAETALLVHLSERSSHYLDATVLHLTRGAAVQFGAQLMLAADEAEKRVGRDAVTRAVVGVPA